ncbi:MAG: hypothetical protein J6A75_04200 [Lachnospiraceae bacterium]|nr:hypothetical protein [Lachnospiraceae bacterium]
MKYLMVTVTSCCLISVFMIYIGAPIVLTALFVAIPVGIAILLGETGPYAAGDYLELLDQCYVENVHVNKLVDKAKHQIASFRRLYKALEEISMVNFYTFAFPEYKELLKMAEDSFGTSTGKVYSRIKVVKAKGSMNEEDYKYILEYLKVNQEILNRTADFINEVTNSNKRTVSVDKIVDFTKSLKKLNEM